VIDYTHGDRAGFLSFLTGAPERITYTHATRLSRFFMNRVIDADPQSMHIIDLQLEALRYLGLSGFDRSPVMGIPEIVVAGMVHQVQNLGLEKRGPRIVLHPGARGLLRQWPTARFAEIADHCIRDYNASIFLIGGPDEEKLLNKVKTGMRNEPSYVSSSLSLLETGALLRLCHLFIGNDSAPGHIAAAVGCPTLTLFGPTFPHMWRPMSRIGDTVFKHVPCCGCRQESCIRPDNTCMDLIETGEVREKVAALLQRIREDQSGSDGHGIQNRPEGNLP
jgi:ADP-heptose:LPS heptosyltransferase